VGRAEADDKSHSDKEERILVASDVYCCIVVFIDRAKNLFEINLSSPP